MNYYELHRNFWDFCYRNPDIVRPTHGALFSFIVDLNNRLGWKEKFSLPTTVAKEAIGIRSYNTYIKTLNDLIDWGFINIHERSKNQFTANIIALSKNDKAKDKALDKAIMNHDEKHSESIDQTNNESIDSIDRQLYNSTNPQKNNPRSFEKEPKSTADFDFEKSFLSLGVDEKSLSDWLEARRKKKAANTESVFHEILSEINKSGYTPAECIKFVAGKSWAGFEADFMPSRRMTATRSIDNSAAEEISAQQREEFQAAALRAYRKCLAEQCEWIGTPFEAVAIQKLVEDQFTIGQKHDIRTAGEKMHLENRAKYYGEHYAIAVAYANAAIEIGIEIKT